MQQRIDHKMLSYSRVDDQLKGVGVLQKYTSRPEIAQRLVEDPGPDKAGLKQKAHIYEKYHAIREHPVYYGLFEGEH